MNEAERFLKERLGQKQANQSSQQSWMGPTNTPKKDSFRVPPTLRNRQYTQQEEDIQAVPQRIASFGEAWMGFWTHWTSNGRASRAEYWWMRLLFALPDTLVVTLHSYEDSSLFVDTPIGIILFLYIFATVVPRICLTVRRLHDANLSSGWWFLYFLPFI